MNYWPFFSCSLSVFVYFVIDLVMHNLAEQRWRTRCGLVINEALQTTWRTRHNVQRGRESLANRDRSVYIFFSFIWKYALVLFVKHTTLHTLRVKFVPGWWVGMTLFHRGFQSTQWVDSNKPWTPKWVLFNRAGVNVKLIPKNIGHIE